MRKYRRFDYAFAIYCFIFAFVMFFYYWQTSLEKALLFYIVLSASGLYSILFGTEGQRI